MAAPVSFKGIISRSNAMNLTEHGGDCYRNEIELDFSINVNPLGMPGKSREAFSKCADFLDAYPDPYCEKLLTALRKAEKLEEETQVIFGNGASELIYALVHALLPKETLLLSPCFQEYENALKSAHCTYHFLDLSAEKEFAVAEEDLLTAITPKTQLVFLCNPNNPTGSLLKKELLLSVMGHCEAQGAYLCVDECFLPFLAEKKEAACSMKRLTVSHPRLIVLRAFTKIYAMAGLRLGYLMTADAGLAERMRDMLPPWNVSIPAQECALAALSDDTYLQRTRTLIEQERSYLTEGLKRCGIAKIHSSHANFILFQTRKGLREELLKQKILIRSCQNFRGLDDSFYRIAVRGHEENRRLLDILQSLNDEVTDAIKIHDGQEKYTAAQENS